MAEKLSRYMPDGFLSPKSMGSRIGHEAVCVRNLGNTDARIKLAAAREALAPFTTIACFGE